MSWARGVGTDPVLAVDLGGTKIACGVVVGSLVTWRTTVPTPAQDGPEVILAAVHDVLEAARQRADARLIGVGSAGVIDERTGTVLAATAHLAGWTGTHLGAEIADRTGLATVCLNDVHAHALGEHQAGAAAGAASSLLVAAGTGLGGSLVLGGQPLFGAHHRAGHLGHVPSGEADGLECSCGGTGHLECIASGAGLLAAARAAGSLVADTAELARRAQAGDKVARRWLVRSGTALGRAIGGWVNTLDPEVVVVAGGLTRAGAIWWDALTSSARAEALDSAALRIVPAALGDDAALVGAAAFARTVTQSTPAALTNGAAR